MSRLTPFGTHQDATRENSSLSISLGSECQRQTLNYSYPLHIPQNANQPTTASTSPHCTQRTPSLSVTIASPPVRPMEWPFMLQSLSLTGARGAALLLFPYKAGHRLPTTT